MQITINLSEAQRAAVEATAEKTGREREQIVLEAVDHLLMREELGADGYAQLTAGLADAEAGRFATEEEIDAVFGRYGVQRRRARDKG